ncbi:putative glucokinase [Blastocladiella britannica]|nr:putative glucokinase [Blastocladiella britannica]
MTSTTATAAAAAANTAAAGKTPSIPTSNAETIYSDLLASFQVPRDKLRAIATHMYNELVKGLHADGNALRMIPSYVHTLPKGTEKGTFLALDLGGTNFRVCAVHLHGDRTLDVAADKFTIPDDVKVGSADRLFGFIAASVASFIAKHRDELGAPPSDKGYKLGFTFSFPVAQTAIDRGTLGTWTKGFDCPDAVGRDVVEMLQEALHKLGVAVQVVALVNDTVGALVAHAYRSPGVVAGLIFGTGTNAAYIEHIPQIPKFTAGARARSVGKMLVNTEWGGFDSLLAGDGSAIAGHKVLPITTIDAQLDAQSTNPGAQLFEKLISGMYLGELTRLALLHLAERGALFGGKTTDELRTRESFHTAHMSAIESDLTPALSGVASVLADHMALPAATLTDRQLVKALVQQIGTRAARLSAVGIFALLEKMGVPAEGSTDKIVVAIDGSVWLMYPGFQERMRAALRELMGPEKVTLVSAETTSDGSGAGAGLIAALADLHAEDE